MSRLITAKNDRVFKSIFVQKDDHHLMEKLISDILNKDIKITRYLKSELDISNVKEKVKRLDVLVECEEEKLIIELNTEGASINKRNFSYFAKFYGTRTKISESYNDPYKYILINLSYNIKDDKDKRIYYVQDNELKKYINNFQIIELNMDMITKECYDRIMNGKELQYKYLAMLNLNQDSLEELSKGDSIVKEFMDKLVDLNNDDVFIGPLRVEEEEKMIQRTVIEDARREGLELGIQEGIQKGLQKGIQKGLQKGLQKGIKEGTNKIKQEIIINLFKDNFEINDISRLCNTSVREVTKIIEKHK